MKRTHHRHRTPSAAVLAASLAVLLAAATGCSSKADGKGGSAGADGVKAGPGVTDKTVRLGALTDLTGPYATLG